ncbi:MAG: GGDEF domain-containing protein [Desulfobacteraceae bacterium]
MKVGEIITSSLRTMDTAYRYGGEEFAVILPETRAEEAEVVGDRIKEKLYEEIFVPCSDKEVTVTASLGITEYCPPESPHSFVSRSDKALYSSKENGRNRITVILKDY